MLFCAPFRRLQNKAQVFSLETNASVRSRLTHSLEVSSLGRFVALQALKAFEPSELRALGLAGNERAMITFVETACLLHDIGNPPFGHFGEIAISDWFHLRADQLKPASIGGSMLQTWEQHYADFQHFDGNPQGFRISTRLQAAETADLCGLNLTATTLAATIKYPWSCHLLGGRPREREETRLKAGYFCTEQSVVDWIRSTLEIDHGARHPLVYLMEAADDIAYCASDIEDGIEKGVIAGRHFAEYVEQALAHSEFAASEAAGDRDAKEIGETLQLLKDPRFLRVTDGREVERLTPMQYFSSAVFRFLARMAGQSFKRRQPQILDGSAGALLDDCEGSPLLAALREFADSALYRSRIVRSRELTAQAVLSGLLDAYLPLMTCDRGRFERALEGKQWDEDGRPIARDSSLVGRISRKYLSVYREAVRRFEEGPGADPGLVRVQERVHRMRFIIDHISGMTDEFALQTFQLISGVHVDPYRS